MTSVRPDVILDWDGTLVPSAWPDEPKEMLPGAAQAITALADRGVSFAVHSVRYSPWEWDLSKERDPMAVEHDINYIRGVLDAHGLPFVNLWTKAGKAPGQVYVDDRAIWFPGRPGSWSVMEAKIAARLGLKGGDDDH